MNKLKPTDLYTLKELILRHVTCTSVKKKKRLIKGAKACICPSRELLDSGEGLGQRQRSTEGWGFQSIQTAGSLLSFLV